jgi:hypothetical protein
MYTENVEKLKNTNCRTIKQTSHSVENNLGHK